jgi:hypothetical protein
MFTNNCELRVLVKGRPITEYFHEAQNFIEGREGTEFEIQVRNKTGNRIMAVVSVDGLSVTEGTAAGPDSSGYVINAYQTITIPGWKLTGDQAAKFTFGSKSSSYVAQASGDASNAGVIGLMLWSEKKPEVRYVKDAVYGGARTPWDYIKGGDRTVCGSGLGDYFGATRGMAGSLPNSIMSNSTVSSTMASASAASMDSDVTYGASAASMSTTVAINNLGTEFGAATTFNTTSTTFNKDVVLDTLAMFYDDARGLKSRGIVLAQPVQTRATPTPNPFPAMGCTPPKGWKG